MSRIYFHFDDGSNAEIYGSERAYMGILINGLAFPCFGVSKYGVGDDPILDMMPGFTRGSDIRIEDNVAMWLTSIMGENAFLLPDGDKASTWQVILNTVYAIGQPMLRLLVRLHAQCEIHCYALDEDLEGVRGAVAAGIESGLYRKGQGWEELLPKLVRPFACSYSVCSQFPNAENLDIDGDRKHDEWLELPFEDQWEQAWGALTKDDSKMLRLKDLDKDYGFGCRLTAFDIRRMADSATSGEHANVR